MWKKYPGNWWLSLLLNRFWLRISKYMWPTFILSSMQIYTQDLVNDLKTAVTKVIKATLSNTPRRHEIMQARLKFAKQHGRIEKMSLIQNRSFVDKVNFSKKEEELCWVRHYTFCEAQGRKEDRTIDPHLGNNEWSHEVRFSAMRFLQLWESSVIDQILIPHYCLFKKKSYSVNSWIIFSTFCLTVEVYFCLHSMREDLVNDSFNVYPFIEAFITLYI